MTSNGADNSTPILVRTTLPKLPLPPVLDRLVFQTERLIIRSLGQDDLYPWHELRTQPEFMAESTLGIVDTNLDQTQADLDGLVKPGGREHFIFGIWLIASGEMIGDCGVHSIPAGSLGWPAVGYKLASAHWGKGYATEAMRAVLDHWWKLPREEVEIEIHPGTLKEIGEKTSSELEEDCEGRKLPLPLPLPLARERVVADVASYNTGSARVLEKLGFEHFGSWDEPDTQLHRLGQPLMLGHYALSSPS